AAEREGLPQKSFGAAENAAVLERRLGGDRVVYGTLAKKDGGWLLKAAVDKGAKPISVTLPAALPEAVDAGALALARLAAAPDKEPFLAPTAPLTKSAEALTAFSRCYATVIEQPIAIETPVVVDEARLAKAVADCRAAVAADRQLQDALAALGLALAIQ